MSLFDSLSGEIDFLSLKRWAWRRIIDFPLETLFWIGAFLRVWAYLDGRTYGLDERSLRSNLSGGSIFDFSRPLVSDQLAPFGFLIAERIVVAVFGDSVYATRLIPLICGVAALELFRRLAERLLSRPAAIVAMVLFAFSDDLIYYASELKPYSWDLAIGLAVSLVSLDALRQGFSRARLGLLGLVAIGAFWISFPSIFVVGGCGVVLLVDRLRARLWREAFGLCLVAVGWSISLPFAYWSSSRLLSKSTSMYIFWNFAFPPFPPTTRKALVTTIGILLETFVTPLNLAPPLWPHLFVGLAVALLALGTAGMARRDPSVLAILLAPLVLALAATALRRYPFHGRLIVWLVPVFFVLIAEGTQTVRARWGRPLYIIVMAFLLTYPVCDTVYHAAAGRERAFNIHGDLRKNQFME